jgi:hypothetical protein
MTFNKRIITAIATGAVLVNAMAPLAFADTLTVSGNGALSNNAVNVTNTAATVVNQTNNTNITNHVDSNASTGGNSSNFNTGGNSTIQTQNASTNVSVTNAAGLNQANISCGCNNSGATVNITGNGAESNNGVGVNNASTIFLNQDNNSRFNNDIDANATTGKNDSSFNTGGSTIISTGVASTTVNVNNKANANIANVGGSSDPNAGGSSVTISGNGALSNNGVALNQVSALVLDQTNNANIRNDVDANARTGNNTAQFNTGGFTGIGTGNATTNVNVNNLANFNAADLNCDCTFDGLTVKVAGNGAESDNGVVADSASSVFPDQTNGTSLFNDVDGNAKTGLNDLGFSTGSVNGDPLIFTGAGSSTTNVNNAGNVNLLENGHSVTLPGNWNVGVNFDLNGLVSFLNGLV